METLYNTAVEAFVRRDHIKAHRALSELLHALEQSSRLQTRHPWYDFDTTPGGGQTWDEWYIKSLKLYIGAHASLYADYPLDPTDSRSSSSSKLPKEMQDFVPPSPPNVVLEKVYDTCQSAFKSKMIPPALMSTFILAALKLQPQSDALAAAHGITEAWLAEVPSAFLERISRPPSGSPESRKAVENSRESYLRVLELFVGEVLGKEGEYEMARAILDGDSLLPSKRREVRLLSLSLVCNVVADIRPYIAIYEHSSNAQTTPRFHQVVFYPPPLHLASFLAPLLPEPIPFHLAEAAPRARRSSLRDRRPLQQRD